ncbi:MAG: 50S ribosomal protein L13 [Chitinivibrionales bacterium]|nr:50S ribosomal protein L13 [Chitinivibrionales bacterium]
MKTKVVNHKEIKREWFVVDAKDAVLGRLASNVAQILTGKNKTAYSPNHDHGDYVIIVNAQQIKLTGNKAEAKEYFRHSQYPGGEKIRSFRKQMELDATQPVIHAIKGMVKKGPLGRSILDKLHVYAGTEHPHAAQKPKELSLNL